jgi:hypothetical protein
MTADDVEYGGKIVRALEAWKNAVTFRMLCRESGVTFSEMIDAWIEWRGPRSSEEPEAKEIGEFLEHFCGRKQIPAEFYLGYCSWEFGSRTARTSASLSLAKLR